MCVSAAKSDLAESCTVDRQCRDINAVCLNAVCSCSPGYTAQQDTCGIISSLIIIVIIHLIHIHQANTRGQTKRKANKGT